MKSLAHVGVAVTDLKVAMEDYRRMGFEVSEPEAQPEQGVTVAFVKLANTTIELLEPLGDNSPIKGFLDKRGPGIHHLALGVSNIDGELEQLKKQNVPLLDQAARPGAHHCMVAFLHPKATSSKVLLELSEQR